MLAVPSASVPIPWSHQGLKLFLISSLQTSTITKVALWSKISARVSVIPFLFLAAGKRKGKELVRSFPAVIPPFKVQKSLPTISGYMIFVFGNNMAVFYFEEYWEIYYFG